jgi:raffinose synthase
MRYQVKKQSAAVIQTIAGIQSDLRDDGVFLTATGKGPFTFKLPGLKRFLALSRLWGTYWVNPTHGTKIEEIPAETQLLLWETEETCGLIIPLLDHPSSQRATLKGGTDLVEIIFDGLAPATTQPDRALAAFFCHGEDPFRLLDSSIRTIKERLGTFRLRTEKHRPGFIEYFGWCTWDAFYVEVSAGKVLDGLSSFKKGGASPGFMVLDDGWQSTTGDLLDSFETHKTKFPDGLSPLIKRAKEEFGVRIFGVWHNFMGYWTGLNPASELAKRFPPIANKGPIRPWENPPKQYDLCLVPPDLIAGFYSEWYAKLRSDGVEMVKTDGQSALELFTKGKIGRVAAMKKYQEAMQSFAASHFLSETIHCMSHGTDVLFHLLSSTVIRNSNDYMPRSPVEGQKDHIRNNAMNSLWTSGPGLPDWDMFQSHGTLAEFHAAGRAISGGPVYVSDKPGQQNFDVLKKLMTPDGRVLLCDGPALPCRDSLFVDHSKTAVPLKIWNRSGAAGIVGVFHCQHSDKPVKGSVSSSDIPELAGDTFAVWSHRKQKCLRVKRGEKIPVELKDSEFDILTFVPVIDGWAALGLIDKFNPSPAVRSSETKGKTLRAVVRTAGTAAFWCAKKPATILVDGKKSKAQYNKTSGLLSLELTGDGRTVRIELKA